jgi:hypothetical protein
MKINVYYDCCWFSFASSAQCGEQATQVCGTCYSVEVPLTGFLSVDAANIGATGRHYVEKEIHAAQIAEIAC